MGKSELRGSAYSFGRVGRRIARAVLGLWKIREQAESE